MADWTTITLAIKESAAGDSFAWHLYVDEAPVATNRTLSPEATQAQRELSAGYLSWFEQSQLPLVEEQALTAIGPQLFETWLADDWADIQDESSPTARRRFVVASDVPAVLNLPWSLLRLPGEDEPIGLDPTSSVRLHPGMERLAESHDEQRPGPLRVLYSACAPRDLGELDYEREEYQLLQTLTQPGQDVAHFGCDLGAFDELMNRVREYTPHVVHLTGHGVVDDGEAYFAFEDEKGYADLRPGDQIVRDALAGRDVQCVFVSGCETGQAPEVEAINGLCQGLVTSGVPLAIGWAASILDDVATAFGDTFYAELSAGESVDRAVVQGRRDARNLCRERTEEDGVIDPSWTLPVLYTATTQAELFDPSRHKEPTKPSVEQRPLPGMTEGHADYFIGRRREQQKLLPELRSGDLNTVLLTALGGVGKSTLAMRLARALQKDGFTPIAVPSTDDEPLTAGRLIDRCYEVFLTEDADGPYQRLRSEEVDLRDKLRLLVQLLNRNPFILVLDNFERNVDRETHEILDDTLAWFLPYLVDNLTGSSRCLVTSRYCPAALGDDLPPVATERSLTDFPESAFFKYLLDDDVVQQRYRSGDLPRHLLSRIYELLGGTPRFLEQVREALQDMPADELEDALDGVDLPEDVDENRLQALRDEYVENLFVRQLYAAIEPPEAREALSRAAVYTIPMPAEGYVAAADADEADVRGWLDAWRRRTFAAPVDTDDADPERWVIPTLLRPWLLDRIDADERREAHQAAGDWLMELCEADLEEEHLDMHFSNVKLEARSRFLAAENYERARVVTAQVSDLFIGWAHYDDVIRLNEEMLNHERHPRPMRSLGWAHLEQANDEEAMEWYHEAVKEAEDRDREELASARYGLATIALRHGDYEEAREEFEEVLQIHQEIGNRIGEARARHQLATISLRQGSYEEARADFERSLKIKQQIGDRRGEASTWHQLARIALNQGDYEKARAEFERSLDIEQEIRNRSGVTSTRENLATIMLRQGDYKKAQEEFEEVLRISREIGDRRGRASARHKLARIALEQGDYAEAQEGFEEALRIRREIEDRRGEASTRHHLARVALNQGEYNTAREGFEEALRIRQEIGERPGEAMTLAQLGILAVDGRGNQIEGLRLLHVGDSILTSIAHAKAERVGMWIQNLQAALNYSEEGLEKDIEYALQSYAEDRGWSLVQEAFPDADIPDDIPPLGGSV